MTTWLLAALVAASAGVAASPASPDAGTYAWPVQGPVLREFEPPSDPYGAGHRGIDIGSPFGTPMVAAQDGVVAFAGWVAGSLFLSIDHADGIRSTYSWLSAVSVAEGDVVRRGQVVGATGHGHPDVDTPHLHFGTRRGSTYLDPMLFLEAGSVADLIHLAPLEDPARPARSDQPWDDRETWTRPARSDQPWDDRETWTRPARSDQPWDDRETWTRPAPALP
jgi:murein DD-endopeptidase MepM/ murein hydrolase activator NlpD